MQRAPSISKLVMREWLCAAAYSFILLSPFTYSIFTFGGKYILEAAVVLAVIFHIIFRDHIGRSFVRGVLVNRFYLGVAIFFLMLLFVIGCLRHGNILGAYAELRSALVLIAGFAICKYILRVTPDSLYSLGMCTAAYTAIYWAYSYYTGQLGSKFASPLFAPATAALIAADRGNASKLVPAIAVMLFLAAVSFFRQYWLVAIFITLSCILRKGGGGNLNLRGKFFAAAIISIAVFLTYGFFYALFNSNQSSYIQSIGKTVDALDYLNGGHASDSDNLRMAYFRYIYDQIFDLVLPHGLALGTSVESENFDPWFNSISRASNTADSLILFFTYHYGALVSVPLLLWLLFAGYKKQRSRGGLSFIFIILALCVPLLFDGGQATVTFRAFWFGAFCAYLTSPRPICLRVSTADEATILVKS